MEYFNHLPEEITMEILSRVPTETVFECKLVCRNWTSLVRCPSFSKIHFKHHLNHAGDSDSGKLGFIAETCSFSGKKYNYQYFEYNENHGSRTPIDRIRRINFNPSFGWTICMGSCNGLICLSRKFSELEKTYICNPITREYVTIPETKCAGMQYWAGGGFGYVFSTNEYKVVTIVEEIETGCMEVHVYTLGSGQGWRNLGKINLGSKLQRRGKGIFLNEALYWLDYHLKTIVTFNLAEEEFSEHLSLLLPSNDDFNCGYYQLGVLDGCLSVGILKIVDGALYWDVGLLKKKNDKDGMEKRVGHQSLDWSTVVCNVDYRRIFAITKSCDVLTYYSNYINILDLEASTSERIAEFEDIIAGVFPHMNTLVSIKELGEEDAKVMESVEIEEPVSHDQPFNQL